jgi:signal transduction histidine kinase
MQYLCIGLIIIFILLVIKIVFLYRALKQASRQMDEIEKCSERNRLIKAISADRHLEELLKKINVIYQKRQSERIVYQRRETQIRHEIENISHDLRTPLTSILGYVNLLGDLDITQEEREEYLKIIDKRARILQGLIQDFYEISRIEREDYPVMFERISVQNIVSEAAVAYFHEFESRKIKVTVQMEEKSCIIFADRIQFNRILNNLIQNALKYAKDEFVIQQHTTDTQCILTLSNDKNDMTENELKRIFDRFYTGDKARNQGSSGLGLTITKLLVEKMKGSISARFDGDMFVIELKWPVRT